MKKIYAIEKYCMGCGLCKVYCLVQHSRSKDIIKAYKKETSKPLSRINIEIFGSLSLALQCRHCIEAPCVDVCLTGAMTIDDDTGAVMHDEKKCIGCWTCVMVCPTGVINLDLENHKVVKCDLFGLSKMPVCVENCPNQALIYKEEIH